MVKYKNIKYTATRIIPSRQPNRSPLGKKTKGKIKKEIPNIQKISLLSNPWSMTCIGVIIEVIPNTAIMLKMLDPTKLPKEMAFPS